MLERAYGYPTKAELATVDVYVAKAEKTGYPAYGNLCANMEYAYVPLTRLNQPHTFLRL